ncbi:MAG: DUF1189 family protein [Elusimicrobiota bacterium]
MKKYYLPEVLWLSFYSKDLYRSVGRIWRARGLAYLVLLVVLITLPVFLQFHRTFNERLETIQSEFSRQLPQITLLKGEIRTPESKPYEIRFGGDTANWILIDPTGKTASLSQTTATILVTQKEVLLRMSPGKTRVFSLSNIEDQTIDRDHMVEWINLIKKWSPVFFYPILFVMEFGVRLLQAALLALAGRFMVRQMGKSLDFLSVLNIALVSLSPALMIQTFLVDTLGGVNSNGLLMFFLSLGYFVFALNAATNVPNGEA